MKRPLILLALCLVAPVAAHAASYTQSSGPIQFNWNADGTNGLPIYDFAGFTSSLGTLTSVNVSVQGFSIDYGSGSPQTLANQVTFNTSFALFGPGFANETAFTAPVASVGSLVNNQVTANQTSFNLAASYTNVAPFLAPLDEFALSPRIASNLQDSSLFTSIEFGSNLAFSLTETFNYVPEPASVALIAAGLLGLAVVRSRVG